MSRVQRFRKRWKKSGRLTPARAMLLDVLYDLAANGEFVSAFAAEKVGGKENRVSIFDCRNTHPDLSMERHSTPAFDLAIFLDQLLQHHNFLRKDLPVMAT